MEAIKRSGIARLLALIFWYMAILFSLMTVICVAIMAAYFFANYQIQDVAGTTKKIGGYVQIASFILIIILYKFNKLPWTEKYKKMKQSNA